jgi:hypothetical protein
MDGSSQKWMINTLNKEIGIKVLLKLGGKEAATSLKC